MRSLFHSLSNRIAAVSMRLLFGCVARVHVLRRENASVDGAFLLASNHISHFDPFIISGIVRRKIDWMAMAEFFPMPVVGFFLRAVDAFPADRDRADRATIRTAIERLKRGRIVGVFPEGGIRDGARSLLEGAPLRPGASTLAHMAGVPILPCVIVGSDRFYSRRQWLPWRSTPVWIAFGDLIETSGGSDKSAARELIERDLTNAFQALYAEIRQKFSLTAGDLPHPPRERMNRSRPALSGRSQAASRDTATERRGYKINMIRRSSAFVVDSLMCASMNLLQSRHRLPSGSREKMESYVVECEKLTAQDYYAASAEVDLGSSSSNGSVATWASPVTTPFAENNVARANLFPCSLGWTAPTVIMLHALMSAGDNGYRRLATKFNALGWNACFLHLPYHYSRVPRGYWNGELAITADLIRNAEGLRQGVIEVRQLIGALRKRGCREFGILGTSYGGWIGALLGMVESDLRFLALMAPIVNVEHAIWQSPATSFMRRELRRGEILPSLVARHYHLSSPMHNESLCAERVLLVAGDYDLVSRPNDIELLHRKWPGSELLRVRQGHFGYRMLRETVERIKERWL